MGRLGTARDLARRAFRASPGWGPIPAKRSAVVVAHGDDETLGCGALLGRLGRLPLVVVTDGAPRSSDGVADTPVVELGVPGEEATLELASIARALATLLARLGIGTVLTHAYEGGHPDRDATAFAVHAARRLIARRGGGGRAPVIVEMPYCRLGPDGTVTRGFADAGDEPVVLLLSPGERRRKTALMMARRAPQSALAAFATEHETFRRAPDYDFTVLPNGRRLLYERHNWGMTGARWREAACQALRELGLGTSPMA